MASRTKVGATDAPHPHASVLMPETLPLFSGQEHGDLLCAGCESVICKSVSQLTMKTRFGAPNQLIVVCPLCRTNNVLPSALISPE